MGKVYGYIWVSSHEQNEARLLLAMRRKGIPRYGMRCTSFRRRAKNGR